MQISVSQPWMHIRISFEKTTTISGWGKSTLLGPRLANSVTVPATLRGVLSNDFFWFNHFSLLPWATCSLTTVFPSRLAQADSALRRGARTWMDPSSSSWTMATVKPSVTCYTYTYPCLTSFLWTNNQNSLSVVNTIFSKKGIHLTKNEELQVPLWFKGRKKIYHSST